MTGRLWLLALAALLLPATGAQAAPRGDVTVEITSGSIAYGAVQVYDATEYGGCVDVYRYLWNATFTAEPLKVMYRHTAKGGAFRRKGRAPRLITTMAQNASIENWSQTQPPPPPDGTETPPCEVPERSSPTVQCSAPGSRGVLTFYNLSKVTDPSTYPYDEGFVAARSLGLVGDPRPDYFKDCFDSPDFDGEVRPDRSFLPAVSSEKLPLKKLDELVQDRADRDSVDPNKVVVRGERALRDVIESFVPAKVTTDQSATLKFKLTFRRVTR